MLVKHLAILSLKISLLFVLSSLVCVSRVFYVSVFVSLLCYMLWAQWPEINKDGDKSILLGVLSYQ